MSFEFFQTLLRGFFYFQFLITRRRRIFVAMISAKNINGKLCFPIMEHFYTIQGEGLHAGRAAYFIRFAGCDVGCSWCDVKESWKVDEDQYMAIEDLISSVLGSGSDLVVITGGEPAMYDLVPLTKALKDIGVEINIETSGAYQITGSFDWICVSPKRFKEPLSSSLSMADELKVIVVNKNDLKWGAELSLKCKEACQFLLQPEWSRSEKVHDYSIEFVKENPNWRLSLQQHKYLNIP